MTGDDGPCVAVTARIPRSRLTRRSLVATFPPLGPGLPGQLPALLPPAPSGPAERSRPESGGCGGRLLAAAGSRRRGSLSAVLEDQAHRGHGSEGRKDQEARRTAEEHPDREPQRERD